MRNLLDTFDPAGTLRLAVFLFLCLAFFVQVAS